jgi:hypothetical protein
MIIKEIQFFLEFANELNSFYNNANPNQKRQILTVLKTWLFYNSHSKNIFWTGRSTTAGQIQRVKEHHYSNLSSVKNIMNDDIGIDSFFALSKKSQFIMVFKFMQWNYSSKEENNRLKEFQDADIFYGPEINGNPEIAYHYADIDLTIEDDTADLLPQFISFFKYENNQKDGLIFEIDLSNQRLTKFIQHLTEASAHFGIEFQVIQLSKKGCIYRLKKKHNNFSDLYRITMFSLWKCFKNKKEIETFLHMYHYTVSDDGPYRNINSFQYPNRAFEVDIYHQNPIFLDTYNNTNTKYNLMSKLLDFFDSTLQIYNFELNKQQFNQQ